MLRSARQRMPVDLRAPTRCTDQSDLRTSSSRSMNEVRPAKLKSFARQYWKPCTSSIWKLSTCTSEQQPRRLQAAAIRRTASSLLVRVATRRGCSYCDSIVNNDYNYFYRNIELLVTMIVLKW